jgi:predicted RNase H-like HicB family nuclease
MINQVKKIKELHNLFPKEINVLTRKDDGTYCAEVKTFKGCFTQADTVLELIDMVNDAVRTYLDVPIEYVIFMPLYLPVKEIKGVWSLI